jgi:very-short-patch-repair endonuclease
VPTRKLPDHTKTHARNLRANATEAEAKLWYYLRNRQMRGFHFRRQHPLGSYILDFYCAEKNLVIEVDGSQHFETQHAARDAQRSAHLEELGLTVLRFDNARYCLKLTA